MSDDVLVKVESVSKKYCRSLKRSLWYGVQDVTSEMLGRSGHHDELRKNEFWAVKDVSFELRRGECLGLIGPNGAGKSTLLKMLNGLVKPDMGRITMRGRIGALIELGAGFNPILTARENIYVNGSVLGFSKKEIDEKFEAIVDFAEVHEFIDTPVQNFSSGMKVRLGFAVAAQMEPDVLLIDEVMAVGDIGFRLKCFRRILELMSSGTTVIVVTHSMIDLRRICERAMVISRGSLHLHENLSEAICLYQQLMKVDQGSTRKEFNGSTEISEVLITNSEGVHTDNFKTGDDVIVSIKVSSSTQIADARLIVTIDSIAGPVGSVSSPFQGFKFSITPPYSTVTLLLKNIPLLIGSYDLSVGLNAAKKGEVIDFSPNVAVFNITEPATDSFGFGLNHTIKFEHEWLGCSKESESEIAGNV